MSSNKCNYNNIYLILLPICFFSNSVNLNQLDMTSGLFWCWIAPYVKHRCSSIFVPVLCLELSIFQCTRRTNWWVAILPCTSSYFPFSLNRASFFSDALLTNYTKYYLFWKYEKDLLEKNGSIGISSKICNKFFLANIKGIQMGYNLGGCWIRNKMDCLSGGI